MNELVQKHLKHKKENLELERNFRSPGIRDSENSFQVQSRLQECLVLTYQKVLAWNEFRPRMTTGCGTARDLRVSIALRVFERKIKRLSALDKLSMGKSYSC
jgi:hypothetical protein